MATVVAGSPTLVEGGERDAPDAVAAIPMGTRFGSHEVVAWLGAGGMGEVYRAHDTKLGCDVAIKIRSTPSNDDAHHDVRPDR